MHAFQIFQVIQQQFWQPSYGSPVLATSLELILAETKFSCLKTDVMMTANNWMFWFDILTVNYHYICYCFHFESILYTIIITIYNHIAIRTLAM